jgi:hypothetical protein
MTEEKITSMMTELSKVQNNPDYVEDARKAIESANLVDLPREEFIEKLYQTDSLKEYAYLVENSIKEVDVENGLDPVTQEDALKFVAMLDEPFYLPIREVILSYFGITEEDLANGVELPVVGMDKEILKTEIKDVFGLDADEITEQYDMIYQPDLFICTMTPDKVDQVWESMSTDNKQRLASRKEPFKTLANGEPKVIV